MQDLSLNTAHSREETVQNISHCLSSPLVIWITYMESPGKCLTSVTDPQYPEQQRDFPHRFANQLFDPGDEL